MPDKIKKQNREKIRKGLIKTAALLCAVLTVFCCAELTFAAPDFGELNSCGIVNKPLSVDPTGKSEGFAAVIYDNPNGLPTSEANAIAETEEGFIWIGSYAGLIRYDGNTFERMDSTTGITSVKCLYVDSKGRLWIGMNDNGVAVMDHGEIRMWGKLDGMKSGHTRAITEDDNGLIYVATTAGITLIDKDFNLSNVKDSEIAEEDMRYLRTGSDGNVYGTTNMGDLFVLRDGKLYNFISVENNPIGGAGAFFPDPDHPGRLYLEAVDYKLYYVDTNTGFNILDKIDVDPLRYLLSLEYIDGKLWICAGNGIGVLENGEFRVLDNLPMNNNVGHVMTDYLGNLWFTSTRQGVMKVVPDQFSDLSERFDIPEAVVNSTAMLDGNLFIGTDTGLMVLGEHGLLEEFPLNKTVTTAGKNLEAYDLIKLLEGCRIRSIIRDSKDRLWISTWRARGLLRYDHGEVTIFTQNDGILSDSIRTVSECKDGSILVALTGGVNVIKNDKVIASYGKEDGIENDESLTVEEGWNDEIILGSNGDGIYIFGKNGLETINVENGLSSDIVMRLKHDRTLDIIWIVTGNSIAYMTPDHQVTTIRKFPYPNNFDLYENSKGDVWVLCSNGIYVCPAEELVANGEINPVHYGKANGLSCLATANSFSELTEEGELYISGSTGVCKVNIEEQYEDVAELKAAIPFVQADDTVIYPGEDGSITIPSNTQKLTVQGFVYNYSLNDPKVSYALLGFDRQATTVNRSELGPVDYTNLSGGSYTFAMNIMDSMGRGNKDVAVTIVKEKAFYEQPWFFIVAILAGGILLMLIVRFYIHTKMRILEAKQKEAHDQFEQTAEALASAIDAKDKYTNGHSRRVAEYSMKIAQEAGMSNEECEKVYFSALLHDVGKIGVPIEILSKKGRLTDEEFMQIKQHPVVGGQILSSIKKSPWLSIGARYHHERMNGRGYPEGLKGEEIPEIARIIAVADAYDAMTSNRSYRNAIPQHIVREEIVKGIGTQFDPGFAKIMIHMIDLDTEYRMQETETGANIAANTSLRCDSIYNDCTDGIALTKNVTKIHLCSHPDDGVPKEESLPSLIIFDSLDEKVHPGEEENKNLLYFEYARIRLDGQVVEGKIRKSDITVFEHESLLEAVRPGEEEPGQRYVVEAVRIRDHLMVRASDEDRTIRIILALPDSARFSYISIGGERCFIHNIMVERSEEEADPFLIPRIAEEVSFIKDCPVGDIPNVQIDGWRSDSTDGICVEEDMEITFHTKSLPSARLVWHCPYISIFSASDGHPEGKDFREYLLLRLDGEDWTSDEHVENTVTVDRSETFEGWENWKSKNKEGLDCTVKIRKENGTVSIETENLGIKISSVTKILDEAKNVYVAITGDQCAITDIHKKGR